MWQSLAAGNQTYVYLQNKRQKAAKEAPLKPARRYKISN